MDPLPLTLLWLGCATPPPEPEPPRVAPDPPTWACELGAWHRDADGDGFGDATARVDACLAPPGHVADATDCDDADPTTFPGAPDVCDAQPDNDCDGVPDPSEVDDDGDGFAECGDDCDDADAAAHPDALEVCNEIDDDCDGALDVDDDSVDVYTCGYCPDPALIEAATWVRRTVNPCVLDPTIGLCAEPPYIDTHDDGARLHRITWRNDGHPLRDELLIFVPPGPGSHNQAIMTWAAYAGFRSLNVGWNSEIPFGAGDPPYGDDFLTEAIYGLDTHPVLDIPPNDSLVGRLEALFAYLLVEDPAGGWDRYWDPSAGGIQWRNIVLTGWSDGGTAAAYLARDHEVDGLLLVSSPKVAEWTTDPRATPGCKTLAFYHREEPLAANDPITNAFVPMGMDPTMVDSDTSTPPYASAQILTTELEDFNAPDCTFHKAMAMDACMDRSQIVPYVHLFCTAADVDTCPP